jgi:hypothetical protein
MKAWTTGSVAGVGTFRCTACENSISLDGAEELPACPSCGGTEFVRASLFATTAHHVQTSVEDTSAAEDTEWREELRQQLDQPGEYIAFRDAEDRVVAFGLQREWTRIGRSLAADIRFDDPSVSRRHALIVRQPDGLRVLDDRSLNGVFVNGQRVEWSPLGDGDEIVVGRHHLHFMIVDAVSGLRDLDAAGGRGSSAAPGR